MSVRVWVQLVCYAAGAGLAAWEKTRDPYATAGAVVIAVGLFLHTGAAEPKIDAAREQGVELGVAQATAALSQVGSTPTAVTLLNPTPLNPEASPVSPADAVTGVVKGGVS